MTIGERMKQRRKELGYSADYIAEKLNVDRSTIFRYEKGEIEKLPISSIEPLAKILNVSVAYLMGWEEKQKSDPKNVIYKTNVKSSDEKPSTFRSPEYFYDFVRSMPSEEQNELFKRLFEQLDKDTLLRLGSLILQIASTK